VKAAGFQEQIRHIEDQLFAVQMDQHANWDRLQDAREYERVNEEVMQRSEDSSSYRHGR
jgi:hypothetical protein